jgi:TRAP-type C4-dicarboxylate transport system permease small subunit
VLILNKKAMKLSAISYLIITTFILISVSIMAALDLSFSWVFFATMIGQILLVYSVYRVLTDKYKTEKTFEDWYEDKPIEKE